MTIGTLLLTGCKKQGCNEPLAFNYDPDGTGAENCVWQPIEVNITFEPVFGSETIDTESEQVFETEDGRKIKVDYFAMYFTELQLKTGDEYELLGAISDNCVKQTSDVMLFNNKNQQFRSTLMSGEGMEISALKFNIGVDQCRNDSLDPTTQTEGPFVPQVPTMYWSWATGYRFISIEGMVDTSANADAEPVGMFVYHTGLNDLLRTVELPVEAKMVKRNQLNLVVTVDIKQMLLGLDFRKDLTTHTMNNFELAEKITENATTAFSVK